ncbi:hypothetical protein D3Y57_17745 [Sphingomonas paeninsulae]|uniref:Magnesium transporter n=1 Tax=Sphingomonas paeninsulae TaxID=2319844 RepID=A0A494TQQ0_SPHPE|nr:CorA family divalent cation transporter [Sphingomonas paeninsulae]AYJ87435.1 hypothetical protein D3Y57_17745 [Sphingomonas paeninsulae]
MPAEIFLYDADGRDETISFAQIASVAITEHKLIWVDISEGDRNALSQAGDSLGVKLQEIFNKDPSDAGNSPQNFGEYIRFNVSTAPSTSEEMHSDDHAAGLAEAAPACRVMFIIGETWLVTFHQSDIGFIHRFHEQDQGETLIGRMSPAGLAASLLDWSLADYFEGVTSITADVDKLDERVLRETTSKSLLGRIVTLRRRTSRIRELLVCNRVLFYGLSRPDLSLIANSESAPHYLTLTNRFERAVDEVEHVRDLINGSFDLFSSRNGIQTNALVKVLTILTAILGYTGAIAGIFGMNVKATVFEGGNITFAVIIGTVVLTSAFALLFARRRKWI